MQNKLFEGIEDRLRTLDGELYDLVNESANCIEYFRELLSAKNAQIGQQRDYIRILEAAMREKKTVMTRERALEIIEAANLGGVLREAVCFLAEDVNHGE